ncbi:hypothetical protein Taro_034395, partial [Colocasia esculenta]|nr:hypothetical protein [Colocasia esculenta]
EEVQTRQDAAGVGLALCTAPRCARRVCTAGEQRLGQVLWRCSCEQLVCDAGDGADQGSTGGTVPWGVAGGAKARWSLGMCVMLKRRGVLRWRMALRVLVRWRLGNVKLPDPVRCRDGDARRAEGGAYGAGGPGTQQQGIRLKLDEILGVFAPELAQGNQEDPNSWRVLQLSSIRKGNGVQREPEHLHSSDEVHPVSLTRHSDQVQILRTVPPECCRFAFLGSFEHEGFACQPDRELRSAPDFENRASEVLPIRFSG